MQSKDNLAVLIADLGYGDAGKGSIVDYLTRTTGAQTVIRYNGGAQAAHNVVTPGGKHHTFAQFGSGTFLPGVRTHLSQYMIVHPLAMLSEDRHLQSLGVQDAFSRTTLDREALVITPFQQAANRLREIARGQAHHGSCGLGIGETMSDWLAHGDDVLFAGDLESRPALIKKLQFLRDAKITQVENLLPYLPQSGPAAEERKVLMDPEIINATADIFQHFASQIRLVERAFTHALLKAPGVKIFEGAQGVLLDEWWGFFPYNTWSTLTFQNADSLLSEAAFAGKTVKLGLLRGYATRHGAGPFVTEDAYLTTHIGDLHNVENNWQRQFRVGYLDLLALRYAVQVTGTIDGLVITNLDRMQDIPEWKLCEMYRYPGIQKDLANYFDCQSRWVSGIRFSADPADLVRQERLTRLLMEMRPVYTPCARNLSAYIERISQSLQLPVAITSYGPTAREKEAVWESPW